LSIAALPSSSTIRGCVLSYIEDHRAQSLERQEGLLRWALAPSARKRIRRRHAGAFPAQQEASLKRPLLDQRVVAGLGKNIYVCEALFARICAATAGRGPWPRKRASRPTTPNVGHGDPCGTESGNQGRRLLACAITARLQCELVISSTVSVTTAKAEMPDGRLRRHRPAITAKWSVRTFVARSARSANAIGASQGGRSALSPLYVAYRPLPGTSAAAGATGISRDRLPGRGQEFADARLRVDDREDSVSERVQLRLDPMPQGAEFRPLTCFPGTLHRKARRSAHSWWFVGADTNGLCPERPRESSAPHRRALSHAVLMRLAGGSASG